MCDFQLRGRASEAQSLPKPPDHLFCSLGTRLSLRGRRVWPTAHIRLVLAYGKLSGCRPQCFHWGPGTRADHATTCTTRSFVTRIARGLHSAPSKNIAGDTHLASQNNYGKPSLVWAVGQTLLPRSESLVPRLPVLSSNRSPPSLLPQHPKFQNQEKKHLFIHLFCVCSMPECYDSDMPFRVTSANNGIIISV